MVIMIIMIFDNSKGVKGVLEASKRSTFFYYVFFLKNLVLLFFLRRIHAYRTIKGCYLILGDAHLLRKW